MPGKWPMPNLDFTYQPLDMESIMVKRKDTVPDDTELFQSDAPVIPLEDDNSEFRQQLKDIIAERWEMRHLKWMRPQIRAMIKRLREVK